ncbi:MAG TPA: hypothetical protein VMG14_02980 [Thermoplasmata archaeon]|nr:hypothetical protein [Thermoplasmata archaeon]
MPSAPPNAMVRRFAAIQAVSLAVKIAAVALLAVLVVRYVGGF